MAELSQAPVKLNLKWRAGDPVSLSFTVSGADWSGTYVAKVNGSKSTGRATVGTLTVSAAYSAPDTTITLTMSASDSAAITPGTYAWDLKLSGGATKLAGTVVVEEDTSP